MPTNRNRRTRRIVKPAIDPAEIYFLQHGTTEGGPPYEHIGWQLFERNNWKPIWEEAREKIMDVWIKKYPGTRPWAWWEFDAPRWERMFDAYFDGTKPEPRQRLGGVGTPKYEFLAYEPDFNKGIPASWITKNEEEFYNGRLENICKNITFIKHKEGDFDGKAIDPLDPPRFESEAAYLQRHGLLEESERRYLAKHPGLLEPERIEND